MDDLTGLTALADREGFLVAFPDAVDKNWNDGRPDVDTTAVEQGVDDVGFLRALVDDVASRLPLDERRVYATGISNGAFMSTRLACEGADWIAAVAPVVGTAPRDFESWCAPARPVAVIAFLGEDDPLVPYEGGKITGPFGFGNRGRVVSAASLEAFWADHNGCGAGPTEAALPDLETGDGSSVVRRSFAECDAGADVVFYHLDGGGHTWPGGKQYLAPLLVGKTNRDIAATELIWQFFAAHPLP
jgi:polyhydroxybutyrate depolymerase